MKRSLFLVLTLLASCATRPAFAADPSPAPSRLTTGAWSWVGLSWTQGGQASRIVGARTTAKLNLGGGFHLVGRLDASRLQDGGAAAVDIQRPSTFSSLEGWAGAYKDVAHGLGFAAFYGRAVDIENGQAKEPLTATPHTLGVGLRWGTKSGRTWVYAAIGEHQAAGPGLKGLLTAMVHLFDRFSWAADVVAGQHWFARSQVAIGLNAAPAK